MAKKKQTAEEKASQIYRTPAGVARQGLGWLKANLELDVRSYLDPAAGDGVYCKIVRELWPDAYIIAVESRPEEQHGLELVADEVLIEGFNAKRFAKNQFTLCATNPPFRLTQQWVREIKEAGIAGVTMLLDKSSAFQRSLAGLKLMQNGFVPEFAARIGQTVRFNRVANSDSVCYSHFIWSQAEEAARKAAYAAAPPNERALLDALGAYTKEFYLPELDAYARGGTRVPLEER